MDHSSRMEHEYRWNRKRLTVLVTMPEHITKLTCYGLYLLYDSIACNVHVQCSPKPLPIRPHGLVGARPDRALRARGSQRIVVFGNILWHISIFHVTKISARNHSLTFRSVLLLSSSTTTALWPSSPTLLHRRHTQSSFLSTSSSGNVYFM